VIARVLNQLEMEEHVRFSGVHSTAIIDENARIHPSAVIGPYCIVGRSVISEDVLIGPYTMIENNVSLGSRVKIREHCTVGGYGFGFARTSSASLVRVPHIGAVVIEEDVEVFPFVNVDCATLTETRIRRGAKLDHYVHVGHNCEVGEDALVTAGVVLCGGSFVGAGTWIGVGAIIKERIRVNHDATVGLGAVVIRDVAAEDVVAGVPAKSIRKQGTKNERT
jgi:UDP-3-O-[3-hydroxymyristoyl] glucosamine N-acyltransferase